MKRIAASLLLLVTVACENVVSAVIPEEGASAPTVRGFSISAQLAQAMQDASDLIAANDALLAKCLAADDVR